MEKPTPKPWDIRPVHKKVIELREKFLESHKGEWDYRKSDNYMGIDHNQIYAQWLFECLEKIDSFFTKEVLIDAFEDSHKGWFAYPSSDGGYPSHFPHPKFVNWLEFKITGVNL